MSSAGSDGSLKDGDVFSRKINTGRERNDGDVAQHVDGFEQLGKPVLLRGVRKILVSLLDGIGRSHDTNVAQFPDAKNHGLRSVRRRKEHTGIEEYDIQRSPNLRGPIVVDPIRIEPQEPHGFTRGLVVLLVDRGRQNEFGFALWSVELNVDCRLCIAIH